MVVQVVVDSFEEDNLGFEAAASFVQVDNLVLVEVEEVVLHNLVAHSDYKGAVVYFLASKVARVETGLVKEVEVAVEAKRILISKCDYDIQ